MANAITKIAVDLIVFDLDGTLADTLPDLTEAANFACRTLGLPEQPPEAIRGMIGGGERKFMERLVGPEHQGYVEECLRIYLDYYTRHCGDLTRIYPGVPETLGQLSRKRLAVLSNKLQRLTAQTVQVLGLEHLFAAVRGGGTDLALKLHPAPLQAIMGDLGVDPGRTVMVGDKIADITTGRGAGTYVVAVTYGYGDRAVLAEAAPDFLLDQISRLPEIIA